MTAPSPIKVLLVEDDEDDYLLVKEMLAEAREASYTLDWVAGFDAAREALRRPTFDVGLLDYRLGKGTGLDLLREAVGAGCPAPLILLTGKGDREVDLAAMKAGAADYLPKDRLTADLLERALRYAIKRRQADDALRQAQKMEAVGRLAGGVAHDMNNMMTVVTGYSDSLLRKLRPDDPSRPFLLEIRKAGERCTALTRQLLAFGRKQLFTLVVLDLNVIMADMAKMLYPLLGADIELTLALDPGLGRVKADPVQIEQVVLNLAVNARDAMPRGGKLTLATANADVGDAAARLRPGFRPGRYVVLTVTDTGCGMDPDTLAHVFEPFWTTKDIGKGTGLGLATVYGIVKQSDGYIFAESTPDAGTAFRIYLPRHEDALPPLPVPNLRPEATGGAEVILVVEDEAAIRGLMRETLEQSGYAVLEASDGNEALDLCRRRTGPIHLLVTDLIMPRMGGAEVAARLTALRPGLKVLYLSGYTEDALVRQGVLDGQTHFLQKPFPLDTLTHKVREILDGTVPAADDTGRRDGDGKN